MELAVFSLVSWQEETVNRIRNRVAIVFILEMYLKMVIILGGPECAGKPDAAIVGSMGCVAFPHAFGSASIYPLCSRMQSTGILLVAARARPNAETYTRICI